VSRATVRQNATEGPIPELHVQRHDNSPGPDHRQASRDPLRTIGTQNRNAIPAIHPNPTQSHRKMPHPVRKLAVRPDLNPSLSKRHQCRPIAASTEPIDHRP
jgi:hypothetical protein